MASYQTVTTWFQFKYPNGRSHERTIEVDRGFGIGDEITLIGHRWRVVSELSGNRSNPRRTLVCTQTDAER